MDNMTNLDGVKNLYRENRFAKVMLDNFSQRERSRKETTVEQMVQIILPEEPKVTRKDVVELYKSLKELGCGDFVIGRRGGTSRFVWSVGMVSLGNVAIGLASEIEAVELVEASEDNDPRMLSHNFKLRLNLDPITISLPDDLSLTEAERLANFIKTLPFDSATNGK